MDQNEARTAGWALLIGLIVLAVALWLAYWAIVVVLMPAADYQARGQFGDMFGGINSLFTALAFAGLLYTIFLQRNELALQRHELELTRNELRGQKEQLEAQNRTLSNSVVHQVLVGLLNEYRSLEMMVAIRRLWDLKRQRPADVGAAYEEIRSLETAEVATLPLAQRLDAERGTLHFQRRSVSHFFQLLGGLYHLDIIPKELLFTHWARTDLRIIPEVLLPIEEALATTLLGNPELAASAERMRRLYDDAPAA